MAGSGHFHSRIAFVPAHRFFLPIHDNVHSVGTLSQAWEHHVDLRSFGAIDLILWIGSRRDLNTYKN